MKDLKKLLFFIILIYSSAFEAIAIPPSAELTHYTYFQKADEVLKMMGIKKLQKRIIEISQKDTAFKRAEFKSKILKANLKNMTEAKADVLADKAVKIWNDTYFHQASYDQMKLLVIYNVLDKVSEDDLDSLKHALSKAPVNEPKNNDKQTYMKLYQAAKDASMNASVEASNTFVYAFAKLLENS